MLLGLLAAAAIAAPQPKPATVEDPDLRCMVAMSFALATIDEGTGKANEDERSGIVALVMYYVGKIDGRMPDFDYGAHVTRLIQTPDYAKTQLLEDLNRCGEEAQERGRTLKDLSQTMQNLVPLMKNESD